MSAVLRPRTEPDCAHCGRAESTCNAEQASPHDPNEAVNIGCLTRAWREFRRADHMPEFCGYCLQGIDECERQVRGNIADAPETCLWRVLVSEPEVPSEHNPDKDYGPDEHEIHHAAVERARREIEGDMWRRGE